MDRYRANRASTTTGSGQLLWKRNPQNTRLTVAPMLPHQREFTSISVLARESEKYTVSALMAASE